MFSLEEMLPSLTTLLSAAFVLLVSPVLSELMHPLIRDYLTSTCFRPRITRTINDEPGPESIFKAATIYLRTKVNSSTRCIVGQKDSQQRPTIDLVKGEEIHDSFGNIELKWKYCENGETHQKFFELDFEKRFEINVLGSYFNHVRTRSIEIQEEEKVIKYYIHTQGGEWFSANSVHPTKTFENLAIDPEKKRKLKDDLKRFVEQKEQYNKVGKSWKRGYLLYGPPGTGKSTLIAAMANYLRFNIYGLSLSDIRSDSELRSILLSTPNRSIIAIEDIDCGAQLAGREQKFTRSGLLNLIDGLCSSCGDGRIFVFTANLTDGLDAALLRTGRVDVPLEMSYCTMDGFRLLASLYLGIDNHQLYGQIEGLLKEKSKVTPAEICEELLKVSGDPGIDGDHDIDLRGVLRFLEQR